MFLVAGELSFSDFLSSRGLAFRLLSGSVFDLTEDQSRRIISLTTEIKEEEKELSNALERVQDSMAGPQMMALAARIGILQNGALPDMDSCIERFRISMEAIVECADYLRRKTFEKILEILGPSQAMRFLAATAQFQLTIRRYGLRRDSERA
ncbi:hypothetical protein ACH5RR_019373 [Cinchona calisaya]|uniref:DOG1 domain-containing protein n=1 Tax=Cinchona calisaya TaxID=153742 RepID=A0ABD2ZQ39_9GENT